MHNFNHCLWVFIHELRFDSQLSRMVLVNEFLQEEELLLEPSILILYFMNVLHAKRDHFGLLADGLEQSIAHKESARVNA